MQGDFASNPNVHLFESERHVNVECGRHMHSEMEIVLVNEGVLCMNVGNTEYVIPKGYGIFVPPFEAHSFHSHEPNHCHVLVFSKELVSYFFEFTKGQVVGTHRFAVSAEGLSLSDKILPNTFNTADYISAQAVLSPLCHDIFMQCGFQARPHASDDCFSTVLEYMQQHFTEPLDLETVARAAGIHPVTLSKLFHHQVKLSFRSHLNSLRCQYAATLIQSGSHTFSEIAYLTGFGSIRSFNRAFLTRYAVTPTDYRNAHVI